MSKYNLPQGVKREFDDIDYWHKLPRNKFVELPNGEKISVYEYMKKFMHEAYANNFSRTDAEGNILQTKDQKEWARRNNNNTNRDALQVAAKSGRMNTLFQVEKTMYDLSDNDEWEKLFKTSGYEESFKSLISECAEDIGIAMSETKITAFIRVYLRISKFLKMVRFDQKNTSKKCKACGLTKPLWSFHNHASAKDYKMTKCKKCYREKK